jgi:enoyl-[acyl-carrier protein] reductase I
MLLQDKKALIFGVVNERSIAYGIAEQFKEQGARLAFSYAAEPIKKRIEPINKRLSGEFIMQCNVRSDEEIDSAAHIVAEKWESLDILVHSIAYAYRDDLMGRFIDTSREGFTVALDVSAFSLVALCRAFEHLFSTNASIITLSYYGSGKVVANYNAMGVAKAALESCVRYLAVDLGTKGVRINAISAGPVKTAAAVGIPGFRKILTTIENRSPLKRNITLEDVGKCALYLASDLSAGTTGDIIFVDSGYNIMGV